MMQGTDVSGDWTLLAFLTGFLLLLIMLWLWICVFLGFSLSQFPPQLMGCGLEELGVIQKYMYWVLTEVLIFRHWLKFSEFTFVYTHIHVNCDHIYMYYSFCCYLTWHTLDRFCDTEAWYEIAHRQQNISQVTFTRFYRRWEQRLMRKILPFC